MDNEIELTKRIQDWVIQCAQMYSSQKEASTQSGIPLRTLQSYIRRQRQPSSLALIQFAICTGRSLDELAGITNTPHVPAQLVVDAIIGIESILEQNDISIPDYRYKAKLALAFAEKAYENNEEFIDINQHLSILEAIAS